MIIIPLLLLNYYYYIILIFDSLSLQITVKNVERR
jgi:hypothetical protein